MTTRLLPIALLILGASTFGCTPTLSDAIKDYGFMRVLAPRKRLTPGTLVQLDPQQEQTSVRVICWREQAFPGLPEALESATMTSSMKGSVETSFKLEAGYLDYVKGDAKLKAVSAIDLSIKGAKVVEYSYADLFGKLGSRTTGCTDAVANEAKNGRLVYTIVQALLADVVYKVSTEQSAGGGVSIPPEILEGVRLSLGAETVNTTNGTIEGKQLHWGIYPDIVEASGLGAEPTPRGPSLDATRRVELVKLPARSSIDTSVADSIENK